VEWFGDNVFPVAYQAVPKDWITFQEMEIFIAPIHDLRPGIGHLEIIFGKELSAARIPNPENPGSYVTKCAGRDEGCPNVEITLAIWDILGPYTQEEMVAIRLGLAPAESGCLKPWSVGFIQQDRRKVLTEKTRLTSQISESCSARS
jgi:hypothetical protein